MLRCSNCGEEIRETMTKPVTVCSQCGAKLIKLGIKPFEVVDSSKQYFTGGYIVTTTFDNKED